MALKPPRGSLGSALWSALMWTLISLLTILCSCLIILCFVPLFPFDRRRFCLHWLATLWGRGVFACNPFWRLIVTGRRKIRPGRAYILVSNHQSLLDIMALFALYRQFKWVAKDDLFRIPFLGWAMSLVGYIKLSRGRYGSIRQTYADAGRWLASGVSVFFFPEGTRSRTGELGAFKNGAFKLALDTGAWVVPIIVSGTRDLLERGSWKFRMGSRVRIKVLQPIDPAGYRHAGPDRFRDDAWRLINRSLQQLTALPHA